MLATLQFNLPEEDYDFKNAINANNMRSGIEEVLERMIRPVLKHGDPSDETREILEQIRKELADSLVMENQ